MTRPTWPTEPRIGCLRYRTTLASRSRERATRVIWSMLTPIHRMFTARTLVGKNSVPVTKVKCCDCFKLWGNDFENELKFRCKTCAIMIIVVIIFLLFSSVRGPAPCRGRKYDDDELHVERNRSRSELHLRRRNADPHQRGRGRPVAAPSQFWQNLFLLWGFRHFVLIFNAFFHLFI